LLILVANGSFQSPIEVFHPFDFFAEIEPYNGVRGERLVLGVWGFVSGVVAVTAVGPLRTVLRFVAGRGKGGGDGDVGG
jgi:hypothetical protein